MILEFKDVQIIQKQHLIQLQIHNLYLLISVDEH